MRRDLNSPAEVVASPDNWLSDARDQRSEEPIAGVLCRPASSAEPTQMRQHDLVDLLVVLKKADGSLEEFRVQLARCKGSSADPERDGLGLNLANSMAHRMLIQTR